MIKCIISNNPNQATYTEHATTIWREYETWCDEYRDRNGSVVTNNLSVIYACSNKGAEFYLDTPTGHRPLSDFFEEAYLSHFQLYELYLRGKFDEYLMTAEQFAERNAWFENHTGGE